MINKIGKLLFKYRALVAVLFFIFLMMKSQPVNIVRIPLILTLVGLVIRAWAAGYIGRMARGQEIKSRHRIIGGPYKILRHPLYIGNFFLVCGTIFLFNPARWLAAALIMIFLTEYGLFVYCEEKYLKGMPEHKEKFHWRRLTHEFSTWLVVAVVWIISFLKMK
jgi:protein-S-isoprenylcysteine O-methyltransferase Ste14